MFSSTLVSPISTAPAFPSHLILYLITPSHPFDPSELLTSLPTVSRFHVFAAPVPGMPVPLPSPILAVVGGPAYPGLWDHLP